MKVIERVEWDSAGRVQRVMWRDYAGSGHETQAEVIDVVDAIYKGDKVHVRRAKDGGIGPIVRTAPAGGGNETITDMAGAPEGSLLRDLPTFESGGSVVGNG